MLPNPCVIITCDLQFLALIVTIKFNPTSYIVTEADGSVTFTIEKIGSTTQSVSVNFRTVDGTATGNIPILSA